MCGIFFEWPSQSQSQFPLMTDQKQQNSKQKKRVAPKWNLQNSTRDGRIQKVPTVERPLDIRTTRSCSAWVSQSVGRCLVWFCSVRFVRWFVLAVFVEFVSKSVMGKQASELNETKTLTSCVRLASLCGLVCGILYVVCFRLIYVDGVYWYCNCVRASEWTSPVGRLQLFLPVYQFSEITIKQVLRIGFIIFCILFAFRLFVKISILDWNVRCFLVLGILCNHGPDSD